MDFIIIVAERMQPMTVARTRRERNEPWWLEKVYDSLFHFVSSSFMIVLESIRIQRESQPPVQRMNPETTKKFNFDT